MSFSCPELTLDEMMTVAARFGYDGVELRLDAGVAAVGVSLPLMPKWYHS